ncbi:hypothetical protein [Planomonospora sp. ID82291]|uniref:hypothetical protein n=1 Tax=Planomonospora sp. ID82291 TaxID=2738136 RepID=UPI0018C43E53|nr:hypothetical protein [Planomonospora sp. ID82291]MBG0816089.1 hypothetical protein [Planomonospora sp. ID82291]
MPASPPRPQTAIRRFARIVDLSLAAVTVVVFVAVALATGVRSPWSAVIPCALFLGAILLLRRRLPIAVLLLSVAAVFAYHFVSWSPAGWIWPVSAAYFTAAATSHVRWVAAIGVAQLVYSAVDARWMLDRNVTRYLIHTLGEGLLLAALVAAGLAYATSLRSRGSQGLHS